MKDKEKRNLIEYWQNSGLIKDNRLIEAFKSVPREKFIRDGYLEEAYGDYPLPIGFGQTISQPTTVMLMIDALELKKDDNVLEVGAGSGYCAAIMSKLCRKVITTEIVPELVKFAKENIKKCKIKNAEIVEWDGSKGYEDEAPYDKIMVTAACPRIPEPLVEQLKLDGIILAPVGSFFGQEMIKLIKEKDRIITKNLGSFVFVPLKGEYGY